MWIDACESEQLMVEPARPPLVLAEKDNGTTRGSRIREVSSGSRRCTSPNVARTGAESTVSVPKRAISAERKRHSSPSSPLSPSPSTPIQDTSAEMVLASRKIIGNQLPESLWPSKMRSLSVAFQSDSFSLPITKREKPVTHALSDRSSSNIAHKQGVTLPSSRKSTPERKRSPLKGNSFINQSENSRPVDGINARLVDQHRWPRKLSSASLSKRVDLSDKTRSGTGMPSIRRLSLEGAAIPLQKLSGSETHCRDDSTVERALSVRSQSSPVSGPRTPSPNKASFVSRGVSPSRTKTITSASYRGPSPSRVRPVSPSRQSNSTASVLSFIVDIKKGNKAANHIEDVHELRLLYNRHLQWLYANAQANDILRSQKVQAEKTLYDQWRTSSDMLDSVIAKRTQLQQLRLKLKLHSVLNQQLAYLNRWDLIERDHTSSMYLATQDLQACILRLPITGGAKGDIGSLKSSVCSAVDVVQAMASSIRSILSRAEDMNRLVSELAEVGARQRAMLGECEALLASTGFIQVKQSSLRTHLIQLRENL